MIRTFRATRRAAMIGAAALLASAMFAGPAVAGELEILPDLVYGHKDGLAMTLDVLKPKAGANGAAILYMVSGGWVSRWSRAATCSSGPTTTCRCARWPVPGGST